MHKIKCIEISVYDEVSRLNSRKTGKVGIHEAQLRRRVAES